MTDFIGTRLANTFTGTSGADFLDGRGGNDVLRGGSGDDEIIGGLGDDTIVGGKGVDTMSGGDGDDTFQVSSDQLEAGELYDGGTGFDTLLLVGDTPGALVLFDFRTSLRSQNMESIVFAGQQNARVVLSAKQAQDMNTLVATHDGNSLADFFIDCSALTTPLDLNGWQLTGINDVVFSTDASDEAITATNFADLITYNGGDDDFSMLDGNDQVAFSEDVPVGGSFNGGLGDDSLFVGGVTIDLTQSTVVSFENIIFSSFGSREDRTIKLQAEQFGFLGVSGFATVLERNDVRVATVDVTMGQDTDFGGSGLTFGGDGLGGATRFRLVVTGDDDAEQIGGSIKGDVLRGGGGDDDILGVDGDDQIIGGNGQDDLTGGAGADRFIYNSTQQSRSGAAGADVIHGFEVGVDKIDLHTIDANTLVDGRQSFQLAAGQLLLAGHMRIAAVGADTVLSFATDNSFGADMQIILDNVSGVTLADLLL